MDIIEVLDTRRDDWSKMLTNQGCPIHLIDDFIHDTYIKLSNLDNPKRIIREDGDVNMYYVYFTLRSRVVDYHRQNKLVYVADFIDTTDTDDFDIDNEILLNNLYEGIMSEVNVFGAYGSKLCKLYLPTSLSLRQLATESGISLTSIHNSLKQYKAYIKEEFEDEYLAYKRHKKS